MPNRASHEGSNSREALPAAKKGELTASPDFNAPLKPIADFVARADFPECVLGEHVDIGGYTGVVVAVVKQSIKVRSPEGAIRGFKSYGLQRIYGPPPEPVAAMDSAAPPAATSPAPVDSPQATPPPEITVEPDFEQPITPIVDLLARPNFPGCALGQHVEIGGYTGVVVEVVNQSLKVRSREGTSRNYNVQVLRNIYGRS